MHELSITESILKIVLKHAQKSGIQKVMTIHLRIGKLSDLEDEWIQRYFDYLSKESIAEGAKLVIDRTPIVMQCNACKVSFEAAPEQIGNISCPDCTCKSITLVSGKEYYIQDLEGL